MRTQRGRTQRSATRLIGRIALGLVVAVAALALVAPGAGATPESDAGAAIDETWSAAGGDGSPLGAPTGDVYAVGPGFGQDFAGGAIYFAPETGARIMYGAILDKYRALGGPADSDLGFPNIDEGSGRIGPQSRNSTFSAADLPVIFWTPETGAWVVRGAINAAWDRLGGSSGVLGVPIADETFDGDVVTQRFSGGQIAFDARTKSFSTVPADLAAQLADLGIPGDATSAINTAYRAAGGASGPLGERVGDQFVIAPDGVGQAFAGGKIYFSPATGAHVVSGAILEKYEAAGGPTGDLGLPNAAESDGGVPGSRVSSFAAPDNPVIFWTADHGAVIVRGALKAAWDKLGGAAGTLGAAVSDQSADGDKVTQKFSGGAISWDAETNAFTTDPANLAESLGALEVPTQVSGPPVVPNPPKDNGFTFHTWWLWWAIPLALLLLASLFALRSGLHRRAAGPHVADVTETAEPQLSAPVAHSWRESERQVSPPSHWVEPEAPAAVDLIGDHELFTHRGAHEALDDPDAVDTAPTRVQADTSGRLGRHALVESADSTNTDQDPYIPGPGSLFAQAFGAAPPVEPRAEVEDDEMVLEPAEVVFEDAAVVVEPDEVVIGGEVLEGVVEPDPDDVIVGDDEVAVEDLYERQYEEPYADRYEEPEDEQDDDAIPPAIHLPLVDPAAAPAGYPVKGRMSTGTYHTPDSPRYDEVIAEIWFIDAQHAEANGFTRAD